MNNWNGPDGEPTRADVQREYPGWRCWRAVSGLYHARRADAKPGDPASVKGEDPLPEPPISGWTIPPGRYSPDGSDS
jgi:hypothetical protein